MQRFWSWLAVNLGKQAGLVSVIGLLLTLALGAGITQLKFTSSQDAYLNKSDQVYKDNVSYQKLFGGEAMLTVITMDKGHTVDELLNDANRAKLDARSARSPGGQPPQHLRRDHPGRRAAPLGQPGAQPELRSDAEHRREADAERPGTRPGRRPGQAARRRQHHARPVRRRSRARSRRSPTRTG